MSSQYERELRAVLAGSTAGVKAVTRSCDDMTTASAMQVVDRPFLVVRAAGSGMDGSGDLLALRGDMCFPIEVKSCKVSKLYLSGRTWTQYEEMRDEGIRCQLMPLYAYRLKGVRGDSWRIFRVETNTNAGRMNLLKRRIPALPLTRNGKPFLDWQQGLPLHKFIDIVCRTNSTKDSIEALEQRVKEFDRIIEDNHLSVALPLTDRA
ncbi:MAG: Holliday junction resolvase [Candidatus Poseidoniales archaeon]